MVAADEAGGDHAGIGKQPALALHHGEGLSMSRNVMAAGQGAMVKIVPGMELLQDEN